MSWRKWEFCQNRQRPDAAHQLHHAHSCGAQVASLLLALGNLTDLTIAAFLSLLVCDRKQLPPVPAFARDTRTKQMGGFLSGWESERESSVAGASGLDRSARPTRPDQTRPQYPGDSTGFTMTNNGKHDMELWATKKLLAHVLLNLLTYETKLDEAHTSQPRAI